MQDDDRRHKLRRQEDYVTSAEVRDAVQQHGASIEELATVLLGPPCTALQGGGRMAEEGLVHQVAEIKAGQARIMDKLDNGIRRRLTQVLVAVITTAGVVVAAWIA